jgi:acetyltransferase-like isoleucine patch superfamily enzyme
MAFDIVKRSRKVTLLSFEEVQQQPISFFQDHQFFSTSSTMNFKKTMVDWLSVKGSSFISLVEHSSVINNDVAIGYNTVILDNNSFMPGVTIGNHCHVVNYVTVAHETSIADFCYICGYSYLCFTHLGEGVVVGLRSSFVPKPPLKLDIPPWTNFLLNSSVNRPIDQPATYFGNRKISEETSLTYNIM